MQIEIQDDFDLKKIAECGQCFRTKVLEDGTFRFITEEHVIYIRKLEEQQYWISCNIDEWETIWKAYFDLERNYQKLREEESGKHDFVQKAMECGCGLRILHQEPWEMLITFIISQRKNIPAISKAVETLSEKYGHIIKTEYEDIRSFPTPEELCKASIEELKECSLGYRASYVYNAIEKVVSGVLDLKAIAEYDDESLFRELLTIQGVGKKVANCVCLFGYGRVERAPIDVWISRAIQEECQGINPFPLFESAAGIIQQYMFYYERNHLKK